MGILKKCECCGEDIVAKYKNKRVCTSCKMRKVHYKVSYEELSDLLLIDNCEICNIELTNDRLKPTSKCIDHSHDTKGVRGVLCHQCNLGIGHLKDDHKILLSAQKYLQHERISSSDTWNNIGSVKIDPVYKFAISDLITTIIKHYGPALWCWIGTIIK